MSKARTRCPKCKAYSGDDWRQCGGSCPMPMSPHYIALAQKLNEKGDEVIKGFLARRTAKAKEAK